MPTLPQSPSEWRRPKRIAWASALLGALIFCRFTNILRADDAAPNVVSSSATNLSVATTTNAGPYTQSQAEQVRQRWLLTGLILVLLGVGAIYVARKPPPPPTGE